MLLRIFLTSLFLTSAPVLAQDVAVTAEKQIKLKGKIYTIELLSQEDGGAVIAIQSEGNIISRDWYNRPENARAIYDSIDLSRLQVKLAAPLQPLPKSQ